MDLELHKNIENDLVKRSSLAQNLIKQLNARVRELERQIERANIENEAKSTKMQNQISDYSRVSSSVQNESAKDQMN